jgi:uncharacterized protein (TIGR02646 family)
MRLDTDVTRAVTASLVEEQGALDAYTGQRIENGGCHIEHVIAQAYGDPGQDVDYQNMVACYPPPNTGQADSGAHPKSDWPSTSDRHLFVSPLMNGCEQRFQFSKHGTISAASPADLAARTTIEKLRLDHVVLTGQRRQAIRETLKNDALPLEDARRRLRDLEQQERDGGRLEPYCFALKQALRKHIMRVESIRASKATKRKP